MPARCGVHRAACRLTPHPDQRVPAPCPDSPLSTPRKASGFSTPPVSSPSAGAPHAALPPPVLLPRSQETTYHRRLRTLLLEFVKQRDAWEDEVITTAEHVGLYCSVLGEIEDEWAEWRKVGRTHGRRGQRRAGDDEEGDGSGDSAGSSASSDEDEDAPSSSRKGRGGRGSSSRGRTPAGAASSLATETHRTIGFQSQLLDSLRTLDGVHAKLVRGMTSIQRIQAGITKLKDEALQLEADWLRGGYGCGGNADTQIRWGRRTGGEFVEAVQALALETALQTACLAQTLDGNLFTARANPLGSLFAAGRSSPQSRSTDQPSDATFGHEAESEADSESDGAAAAETRTKTSSKKQRKDRPVYSPARSSAHRQAALFAWRDLVYVDRSRGIGSFDWWESVWSGEVGRWNGDD